MNKELKQQAHKEFCEKYIDISTPSGLNQKDYRSFTELVKNIGETFIDSLIDKTVQMTEERIVGLIEVTTKDVIQSSRHPDQAWYDGIRCLKSSILTALITNKSDINKLIK